MKFMQSLKSMKVTALFISGLSAFALLAGCQNLPSQSVVPAATTSTPSSSASEEKIVTGSTEIKAESGELTIGKTGTGAATATGAASGSTNTATPAKPMYVDYSDSLYKSLLGKKAFALFFHAGWCPTCRQIESDIKTELETFPVGTEILKTDYDTSTELKKTYGIVSQSIIVVLDAKGNEVAKLVAPDNDALKAAIQKSLK